MVKGSFAGNELYKIQAQYNVCGVRARFIRVMSYCS